MLAGESGAGSGGGVGAGWAGGGGCGAGCATCWGGRWLGRRRACSRTRPGGRPGGSQGAGKASRLSFRKGRLECIQLCLLRGAAADRVLPSDPHGRAPFRPRSRACGRCTTGCGGNPHRLRAQAPALSPIRRPTEAATSRAPPSSRPDPLLRRLYLRHAHDELRHGRPLPDPARRTLLLSLPRARTHRSRRTGSLRASGGLDDVRVGRGEDGSLLAFLHLSEKAGGASLRHVPAGARVRPRERRRSSTKC